MTIHMKVGMLGVCQTESHQTYDHIQIVLTTTASVTLQNNPHFKTKQTLLYLTIPHFGGDLLQIKDPVFQLEMEFVSSELKLSL